MNSLEISSMKKLKMTKEDVADWSKWTGKTYVAPSLRKY